MDQREPWLSEGPQRRSRAFGLEIDSRFDVPGLAPAHGEPIGPRTRLELASAEAISAAWPTSGSTRVMEEQFDPPPVPPARTIDVHPEAGYRLYARGFGLAHISPGGDLVTCAPPEGSEHWSWQRFLVGRVLPWAAVLQGYEVFHASAVTIGGRAVALIGATGGGKSAVALRLVAGGAGFLTDDVLVIAERDGHPDGHPGACIAAVRPSERELIPQESWARLGVILGVSGKTYVRVPVDPAPVPIGAIYFLGSGPGPLIEPVDQVDPRLLLASTFVLGIQSGPRLRNQLEICALLARRVPMFTLRPRRGAHAGEVADAVRDHVVEAVPA